MELRFAMRLGFGLLLFCQSITLKSVDATEFIQQTPSDQREADLRKVSKMLPEIVPNIHTILGSITSGVTNNETCTSCRRAAEAFRIALKWLSKDELTRYGTAGCNHVGDFMTYEVCLGLLRNYVDSIFQVGKLVFNSEITENDICSLIFGPECGEIAASSHIWEVALPPVPKNTLKKFLIAGNFEILHISDIHLDPSYRQGTLAQCGEPLCCRNRPTDTEETNFSDSPLAGRFGDLRKCDMPFETIESLVNDASSFTDQRLSHVYLTGDIPPHDVWKSDEKEYYNISKRAYDLLKKRFPVKIFPVVGNHEAAPPNLFSTKGESAFPERHTPELYTNLASFWSPWLGPEQVKTILLGGYYSISVSPALKVIALNTNLCYYLNLWLFVDSRDPAGQLAWLVEQLRDSEIRGQKVHILGHVPPGGADCIFTWSAQFLKVVQRFNATITGQFYGHTHYDEFRVFYGNDRKTPVGAAFIAPSATPYSFVNPAYKVFTYSGRGVLLDAVTRTFNLTEANKVGRIDWEVEYKARSTYNVKDLSPVSMDAVSRKLTEDSDTFRTYYRLYHRSSPHEKWSECAEECQRTMACSTRTDVHHNNSACLDRNRV